MKKILTFLTLSLLLGIGVANAQIQKVAVLECFTSTTCGPCASANPSLDNLINNNADNLIAIKYHVNWPSPGNDPMNQHNPSDVSSRVSYYNVNSVPWSVGDGQWSNLSTSVNQNLINQWCAVESPLDMRLMHYLNDNQDTITVVVMGRATSAIESNDLRLRIAVIEKTMEYPTAPGTNGERIFHNVMKKMLPTSAGAKINAMQAGDYFAFKCSWALANVFDINELTAVAWLQNNNGKNIYQGCKSSESFAPFYAKQAQISKLDHMKSTMCSSRVNPDIYVTNFGSESINSLIINVTVNGENYGDLTWNGNIASFATGKVNFGELDFSGIQLDENNEVVFTITQINGAADDYAPGTFSYSFTSAPSVVNKPFKLIIRTDDEPQMITWDVINTFTGEVVVNGGPYDQAHHQYTENFELDSDGCYMFTVYDAGGNGLNSGSGFYALKVGSQTIISGSDFTDKESSELYFTIPAGMVETSVNTADIYPNPSNGTITVDTEENGVVSIYNTSVQMVYTVGIEGYSVLNLSNLEKGTYLLVLTNNFGESSKKVIVLQ